MNRAQQGSGRQRGARRADRLVALTLAGFLAFDYPLASLFAGHQVLGLPAMPVYLFVVWAAFIGLLAWTLEGGRGGARGAPGEGG